MNEQFSTLSKELTKKLDDKDKKANGIYFTPKNIVIDMLSICKKHNKKYICHYRIFYFLSGQHSYIIYADTSVVGSTNLIC